MKDNTNTNNAEVSIPQDVYNILRESRILSYVELMVKDGNTPKAGIWHGRRILRCALQMMVEKALESGFITTVSGRSSLKPRHIYDCLSDTDNSLGPNMYELKTKTEHPECQRFVAALKQNMAVYKELYEGSYEFASSKLGGHVTNH